jgi:hypothetical protein
MDAGIAELRRCWSNSYPDAQLVADMSRGFRASFARRLRLNAG